MALALELKRGSPRSLVSKISRGWPLALESALKLELQPWPLYVWGSKELAIPALHNAIGLGSNGNQAGPGLGKVGWAGMLLTVCVGFIVGIVL